jgi:hypothetical protein
VDGVTPRAGSTSGVAAMVFAPVVLAQLPLILNPGYFGRDEPQWVAYADLPQEPQWPSWYWAALTGLQYRTLTFEPWFRLSRNLFTFPYAFHDARRLGTPNRLPFLAAPETACPPAFRRVALIRVDRTDRGDRPVNRAPPHSKHGSVTAGTYSGHPSAGSDSEGGQLCSSGEGLEVAR